jgi:hypothetical protein
LVVSLTENVNPVAVLELPGVGDQSTITLVESPFPEVIADIDRTIEQSAFAGVKLKVGSVTALLVPPIV